VEKPNHWLKWQLYCLRGTTEGFPEDPFLRARIEAVASDES